MDSPYNIPPSFYNEETRLGYTISADMKKIWAVELELLCELDRVCETLGIQYFLDSGTLLGAVRDHHFIPWDDDIDVIMLREDYEALKENGNNLFNDNVFFQCAYTDKYYSRGQAQLRKKGTCAMIPYESKHVRFDQGIFIDIFVLDGVAENNDDLVRQFTEKNHLMGRLDIIGIPSSTIKRNIIAKKVVRPFLKMKYSPFEKYFHQYEEICCRYNDSAYVDKIMFRESPEQVKKIKKEWFSKTIKIEFEGGLFPIPHQYDKVLKAYYGDNYMTPAKAPTAHGGLILDSEHSYKDVLKRKRS